jgi:hypothetical protein
MTDYHQRDVLLTQIACAEEAHRPHIVCLSLVLSGQMAKTCHCASSVMQTGAAIGSHVQGAAA